MVEEYLQNACEFGRKLHIHTLYCGIEFSWVPNTAFWEARYPHQRLSNLEIGNVSRRILLFLSYSRKGLNQLVLLVGTLASIFVFNYLIFFFTSPNVLYLYSNDSHYFHLIWYYEASQIFYFNIPTHSTSYMEVLYFTLLFHRSCLGILRPANGFAFGTTHNYTWVLESVLINKMSGDDVKWEENVVYVILFKLHLNFV